MTIKRGPDGRIIEDRTVAVPTTDGSDNTQVPKRSSKPNGDATDLRAKYDTPTVKRPTKPLGQAPSTSGRVRHASGGASDPKTRVMGREGLSGGVAKNAMDDPVSGWLVVIKGPGKGNVLTLGFGLNTVGRGSKMRQVCDFGDDEISREAHCLITFDPRSQLFHLQHGEGVNLTYKDGGPVLQPVSLVSHDVIEIGATHLRFVPFCSPEWDWAMTTDQKSEQ